MTPRTLLRRGIERSCKTQKEAARRLNYTPGMLNKILAGERNIASEVKPKMAQMHLLAGLALAQEVTGYSSIFGYIDGDRHPQTMLRRVEKEDAEADAALKSLGWRIIDKNSPDDLSKDDVFALVAVGKELSERIKADLNLLVELEDRFQLGLLDYLTGEKEKSPACVAAGPRANLNF